jgi:nicotinate-nucleotide adenylyltransferase
MKIGVLGGTFDPVHIGHIKAAEAVTACLGLDEILFVPAGQPWFKAGSRITPAAHRVAMLRLALEDKPRFQLSAMEIERSGPTYTVETITEINGRLDTAAELYFIMGWDNLAQLPRWREPSRLITLCRIVAVRRVDFPEPDLAKLETAIPGLAARVILLYEPRIDVNASKIRQRLAGGETITGMVPETVERYIASHGLYRQFSTP